MYGTLQEQSKPGNLVLRHSVKTFPFSTFCPILLVLCVFSSGTQIALPQHQIEEMKIENISFPRLEIEPATCCVYTRVYSCAVGLNYILELLILGLHYLLYTFTLTYMTQSRNRNKRRNATDLFPVMSHKYIGVGI